jgi:lipopolysaccharide/colanic/teichoic acid biosynthesis glycosyltransferase
MIEASNTTTTDEVIAFVGFDEVNTEIFNDFDFKGRKVAYFPNGAKLASDWKTDEINIVAIIAQGEIMGPFGLALINDIKKQSFPAVPFFLVINHINTNLRQLALTAGIVDVFVIPVIKPKRVERRVNFTIENWAQLKNDLKPEVPHIKSIQFSKRLFDVFFAGSALLLLSPLFLIIYILVKLESKGPAFYYSLRVGTGYKVFKFYKFRSMFVNADQRIKDLKHLNQYAIDSATEKQVAVSESVLCDECAAFGRCQYPMYADNIQWCEKDFRYSKIANAGSAFFKIKNDPRITRIGNFIRNTSIDELPQLWNVVIGNMSIVGNRPLPLYEAEKLTTDKYILRFSAPAGITGLWQVEKRGKGQMSEDERLMLDNVYAQTYSLKNDLKLILRTIPALLQKENV